jgi:hypothetical protein
MLVYTIWIPNLGGVTRRKHREGSSSCGDKSVSQLSAKEISKFNGVLDV